MPGDRADQAAAKPKEGFVNVGALQTIKFAAPLDVETVKSSTQKRIVFDNASASAVLFVDVGTQLQSGNLYVCANVVMYPKAATLLQFGKKPNDSDPFDAGQLFPTCKTCPQSRCGSKSDARHRDENLGSMSHVTQSFQNISMIV